MLILSLCGWQYKMSTSIFPLNIISHLHSYLFPKVKHLCSMESTIKAENYPFTGYVLIDVRSEAEFKKGHIPGAVNIPLLRNEERVAVGTCYKQNGRDAAVELGFELIGPRFAEIYRHYKEVCEKKTPLFYCWRGGLRSQISHTIFTWGGFSGKLLKGGYKAYRTHVQNGLNQPKPCVLLGGMTGSGKTEILSMLEQEGFPIVDLETLASHRGSVLGSLGMGEQPSVEMFENLLWEKIKPLEKLILESESRKIGACILPEGLWASMLNGKVIELQVSFEQRLHRLTNEYAGFDAAVLAERTDKLRKRLGGLACEQAKIAILEGRKREWVEILMGYYDKSYNYFMEENGFKPNSLDWDWSQTENSLNLLKEKLKEYGITK